MTKQEIREQALVAANKAMDAYKEKVRQDLMECGTLQIALEDEPLTINDRITLDKARCNGDYVQFHVVEEDGETTDYWLDGYMLGLAEIFAMENIIFPDGL